MAPPSRANWTKLCGTCSSKDKCWVTSTEAPIESPTIHTRPFTTSGNHTGKPPSCANLEKASFAPSLLVPNPCASKNSTEEEEEDEDDDDASALGVIHFFFETTLPLLLEIFCCRRFDDDDDDDANEEEEEEEEEEKEDPERNVAVAIVDIVTLWSSFFFPYVSREVKQRSATSLFDGKREKNEKKTKIKKYAHATKGERRRDVGPPTFVVFLWSRARERQEGESTSAKAATVVVGLLIIIIIIIIAGFVFIKKSSSSSSSSSFSSSSSPVKNESPRGVAGKPNALEGTRDARADVNE
jgi:hypothetical protein